MEMQVQILNEEGFHARPAGIFVKAAGQYKSKIEVVYNGKRVNAKSLISLLSLGLTKNSQFSLAAEGEDATLAVQNLAQLVAKRFEV